MDDDASSCRRAASDTVGRRTARTLAGVQPGFSENGLDRHVFADERAAETVADDEPNGLLQLPRKVLDWRVHQRRRRTADTPHVTRTRTRRVGLAYRRNDHARRTIQRVPRRNPPMRRAVNVARPGVPMAPRGITRTPPLLRLQRRRDPRRLNRLTLPAPPNETAQQSQVTPYGASRRHRFPANEPRELASVARGRVRRRENRRTPRHPSSEGFGRSPRNR